MADIPESGIRGPGSDTHDIMPLGRGQYRVVDGTRQRIAYAAGPPQARWVFLNGQVYLIDTVRLKADTTHASAASGVNRTDDGRRQDDELALAAPMPATVASIHVAAGQDVKVGDLLVMLEAMKMELPIRAPRAGRVRAIACRHGELVQPGVPLVDLE